MSKYCTKCGNLLIVAIIAMFMLSGCGKEPVSTDRELLSETQEVVLETETMVIETPKTEEELFALAEELFQVLLNGEKEAYYDDHLGGAITVYKEYYGFEGEGCVIIGRDFPYGFSSAACIDVVGNTYYFHQEGAGHFNKIELFDNYIVIYAGASKQTCDNVCGQIGDSPETLTRDFTEVKARTFMGELVGIYNNTVTGGTIEVRAAEPYGYNSYANFEIVGEKCENLYDTFCNEVIDNVYYFDFSSSHYKIIDNRSEGEVLVYYGWGQSRDKCTELIGAFQVSK